MKQEFKVSLVVAALLAGAGGWVWQRQHAVALKKTIADLRQTGSGSAAGAPLPNEVGGLAPTETGAQIREEMEKTRKEIAALQTTLKLASYTSSAKNRASGSDPFTANRDPEKGAVRVEHFRNVGQATPAAAFQTLIWALVRDDGTALPALLGISAAGREKLHAMVARMPAEKQASFRPPEKVVGMLLALELLEEDGFQIGEASEPDKAGQAKLTVRRARSGRRNLPEKKLPFQRGPGGWQFQITDATMETVPKAIEQASMYVPPKPAGN